MTTPGEHLKNAGCPPDVVKALETQSVKPVEFDDRGMTLKAPDIPKELILKAGSKDKKRKASLMMTVGATDSPDASKARGAKKASTERIPAACTPQGDTVKNSPKQPPLADLLSRCRAIPSSQDPNRKRQELLLENVCGKGWEFDRRFAQEVDRLPKPMTLDDMAAQDQTRIPFLERLVTAF
jgi:hypothetical protein